MVGLNALTWLSPKLPTRISRAERAEAGGGLDDSPRRVQLGLLAAASETGQQDARGRVDIDEPVSGAGDVIVLIGILLGVRHVEISADRFEYRRGQIRRELADP